MEKSKFRMPTAYTILFLLIILVAVATWIVPSGAYEYVDEVPVAGSYHSTAPTPQGVGAVLKAAFSGFGAFFRFFFRNVFVAHFQ